MEASVVEVKRFCEKSVIKVIGLQTGNIKQRIKNNNNPLDKARDVQERIYNNSPKCDLVP